MCIRDSGETVHGTAPNEVVHLLLKVCGLQACICMGESGPQASQASQGLSEDSGFRYILVIMDDLSSFVSMEPVVVCTAAATAESLLTWCKTLGVPRVWVSDATRISRTRF